MRDQGPRPLPVRYQVSASSLSWRARRDSNPHPQVRSERWGRGSARGLVNAIHEDSCRADSVLPESCSGYAGSTPGGLTASSLRVSARALEWL